MSHQDHAHQSVESGDLLVSADQAEQAADHALQQRARIEYLFRVNLRAGKIHPLMRLMTLYRLGSEP